MSSAKQVLEHLERAESEDDYSAVNTLWIGLSKAAQVFDGTEDVRAKRLFDAIGPDSLREVLHCEGAERLLTLEPPIESMMTYPNEDDRLDAIAARKHLETIREARDRDPRRAAESLGWLLRRVRNRREHGFKTPNGPRDAEILSATCDCLRRLNRAALDVIV